GRAGGRRGAAVAASVRCDGAVVGGAGGALIAQRAVVEEAAVQQDEGVAGAGVRPEQVIHDNQGVILARRWQLRCHHGGVSETGRDPASGELTDRLIEVFDLVGPLYRRAYRKVEQDAPVEGLTVGVRAVLNLLREHGPMTVPQMGRAQALSRQFVQRMTNEAAALGLVESVPNPAHRRSSLI